MSALGQKRTSGQGPVISASRPITDVNCRQIYPNDFAKHGPLRPAAAGLGSFWCHALDGCCQAARRAR